MRILIVEDEVKIATALKRGLEQEAYAVDMEHDGDSGLGAATSEPYDLIILDRMLPGGYDGMSIAKELRAAGKKIPILMLTAKDAVSDRVGGLDAGADDYLVKPFAFEELLARVRALLRRPEPQSAGVLTYKDIEVNIVTKAVKRAGQSIDLTRKEYALLEYFLRNPEVVLSKQQLTEHVWNFDADILPNTVEVYVGYLRGKVEKPFKDKPQLFHTKRGFGYVMKEQA